MNWLKALLTGPGQRYPDSDSPPELAAELIEAEHMSAELVDYLLSDRLFWQIVVETPLGTRRPKMTLGGLWERIENLDASESVGPQDSRRLTDVKESWNQARLLYPEQWRDKLNRELESYLQNWRYFMGLKQRDPEQWREDYEVELRNRHRVEELLRLLGSDAPSGVLEELETLEADEDSLT